MIIGCKSKSSKDIQESYIPVVNVEIPKNDTAPKSDSVSIATNDNPATIAGLADGRIIEKKIFLLKNLSSDQVQLNFEIGSEMELKLKTYT